MSRKFPIRLRMAGVTLIELLVVITIAAILMGIGVPSYKFVTTSNRVSTEVNGLLGDMQFARSEAIKEGQSVTVCPSSNGTSCLAATTTWHGGWIVFSDVNGNAAVDAPPDIVLRVQAGFTHAQDTFVSDNNVAAVTFNREGFAVGLPATAVGYITVTLHSTPNNTQWTRCLQVGMVGVLTTERVGTGTCT
jgi:type IV fimbrial biogenesis protein FimT